MSSLWRLWIWATWRRLELDMITQVREEAPKGKNRPSLTLSFNYITHFLQQEVLLDGFWTGLRLTPPHRVRDSGSHVAVGWIKERTMGRL